MLVIQNMAAGDESRGPRGLKVVAARDIDVEHFAREMQSGTTRLHRVEVDPQRATPLRQTPL